jgi:hypothetical protein
MSISRRTRRDSGWPRRSATPCSVTMRPASLRGVLTGPDSCATMRLRPWPWPAARRWAGRRGSWPRRAEIHRAAHGAHVAAGRHLGVDLAGQVHLDGGVDGGQLVAGFASTTGSCV